jgi:hypothetical protein
LQITIQQYLDQGKINSKGVAKGLLSLLDAAEEAQQRGNVEAAVGSLKAFINLVQAQSGKKISTDAANLLISGVEDVLATL